MGFNKGNELSRGIKSDCKNIANTRYLTRIITILLEEPEPIIKNIFRTKYGMALQLVNDGLNWLVNNKIVLKEHPKQIFRKDGNKFTQSVFIYRINPKFLELKPLQNNQPQKTRIIKVYLQKQDEEKIQKFKDNIISREATQGGIKQK